jgi:hypothetical protein
LKREIEEKAERDKQKARDDEQVGAASRTGCPDLVS